MNQILSNKDEICVPYKIKESYAAEDMKIKIKDGYLSSIGKNLKNASGESVGIRVFRNEGVEILKRSLEKEIRTENFNLKWYASGIERILQRGHKINTLDIKDLYWHDVDYPNDLNNAKLNINKIISKKKSSKLKIV